MKRLLDYSRFVSCCRRYRTAKAMLNEESFDPVSLIDMDIKRTSTDAKNFNNKFGISFKKK